jgi:hypothetical protein
VLVLLLYGQVIPDTPFGAKQGSWGTGVIVRIGIHVIRNYNMLAPAQYSMARFLFLYSLGSYSIMTL